MKLSLVSLLGAFCAFLAAAHSQTPAFNQATNYSNGGTSATKVVASIVEQGADAATSRFAINFNQDDLPDIAVLDTTAATVTIGVGGQSAFSFQPLALTPAVTPYDMAVGNVAADPAPDIVVAEGSAIEVYASAPALPGGFANPVSYAAPAGVTLKKVVVADWDGDGAKDVVAAGTSGSGPTAAVHIAIFKNIGTALAAAVDFPIPAPERSVAGLAVGDVNGDNLADIVFCDDSNMSWVHLLGQTGGGLEVNGGGTVISHRHDTSSTGFSPRAIALGDVTGDGSRDVVLFGVGYDNTGQALNRASVQLWSGGASFANFPSTRFPLFQPLEFGLPDIQGDVDIADVAGDFRPEIVVANYLTGRVSVFQGPFAFTNNPEDAVIPFGFPVGDSPRRVSVGDVNGDGFMDVVSANGNVQDQLSVLLNAAGGDNGGQEIPPGRVIQFGEAGNAGHEGATIHIPIMRGEDSTGQVVAYFTVGGTAIDKASGLKNPDFEITSPAGGLQAFSFEDGEHQKDIEISILSSKGAESVETIDLQLITPWGDAELGAPTTLTVYIVDGAATVLKKPSALAIKPSSVVKTPAAELKNLHVKAVARTHALWDFSVTQAFPKGAANARVRVQTSTSTASDAAWTDLIDLANTAGAKWSGHSASLPLGNSIYFRTVSSCDGFADIVGASSAGYKIVPGPDLAFSIRQQTGLTSGSFVPFTAGTYTDDTLVYRFSYTNVSGPGAAEATNVVLTVPIPKHLTVQSFTTMSGTVPAKLLPNSAKPTSIQWQVGTVPPGGTGFFDLVVQVDPASQFSRNGDPLKAIGQEITLAKYTLASAEGGKAIADRDALTAVVHGPIELRVDRDVAFNNVKGGDLITYTLQASNTSGSAVNGAVVRNRIPRGTVLETLYAPDANGNSTNTPLLNPGPSSNPAVVYVLLADARFLGKKKGDEVDLSSLDARNLQKLVDASLIAPSVRWSLGSVPAHGQADLKFVVRVLYDAAANVPKGVQPISQIVNDDFDFTVPAGTNTFISALYGQKPNTNALTSTVLPTEPATAPAIGLEKVAAGDTSLNNPNFRGNGTENVAGVSELTTAVQHHGFDYELHYRNTGTATARQVVLHDVIPAGTLLRGFFTQSENGGDPRGMSGNQFTYFDAAGNVMPDVTAANLHLVRSMDIRLSAVDVLTPLPPGASGVIRYTVEPTIGPTPRGKPAALVHAFGGFDPSRGRSDPLQGAYITTIDQQRTVDASPEDCIVKMVGEVSWNLTYTRGATEWDTGSLIPFDFTYTHNGETDTANTAIEFPVPLGTSLLTNGADAPHFTDGLGGSIATTVSAGKATLNVGTSVAGATRKLRVVIQVSSPLHATLAVNPPPKIYLDYPVIRGNLLVPAAAAAWAPVSTAGAKRFHILATPVPQSTATVLQPVPRHEPGGPKLSVSRTSPYCVPAGQPFFYEIRVTNCGDAAATNVNVGMQVPYFTRFLSTNNGLVNEFSLGRLTATRNPMPFTTTERSAQQAKGTGAGHNIVTWHFAQIPAHGSAILSMKVQVNSDVADVGIRDYSLYASADNASSAVLAPNPIGTWVMGKTFDSSKWEVLGKFCDNLGITLTSDNAAAMTVFANKLTKLSSVQAYGGMDALEVASGKIIPLGNDQVLVIGSSIVAQGGGNIVAQGGGNIVAQGGGNIVAQGAGNAISISGPGITGTQTASYLLDHALDIVAQGGGNLIRGGAGNLISDNGLGVSFLKSNHVGGASIEISTTIANAIASGANIVAQGGGNIIGVGTGQLITNDGGSLITNDGGSIITITGDNLSVFSGGNVISTDGASVISNDGASIISTGGAGLISNDGGSFQQK